MTTVRGIPPHLWPRIRPAFDELLDAAPAERPAMLERIAAGDTAMRRGLETLLDAHQALESGAGRGFLADEPARDALLSLPVAGAVDEPSLIGHSIDGYRIVGRLGEGGMGIVYEAEQASPRRPVALKVIRGSAFLESSRLRAFQREADALARLRHPGIEPINDPALN